MQARDNESVLDNKVSHKLKNETIDKTNKENNISSCYVTNQFTSWCPNNPPPFWLCTVTTSSNAFIQYEIRRHKIYTKQDRLTPKNYIVTHVHCWLLTIRCAHKSEYSKSLVHKTYTPRGKNDNWQPLISIRHITMCNIKTTHNSIANFARWSNKMLWIKIREIKHPKPTVHRPPTIESLGIQKMLQTSKAPFVEVNPQITLSSLQLTIASVLHSKLCKISLWPGICRKS